MPFDGAAEVEMAGSADGVQDAACNGETFPADDHSALAARSAATLRRDAGLPQPQEPVAAEPSWAPKQVSKLIKRLSGEKGTSKLRQGIARKKASRMMLEELPGINPEDGWYTTYPTYIEYQARMMLLASKYPSVVSTFGLSRKTYQRQEIQALRINTNGTAVRKRVLLVGMQHAREWISGMVPMYIAEVVAGALAADPQAPVLSDFEFILVPVANPDGYTFTYKSGGDPCTFGDKSMGICDRLWRKNRSPVSMTCYGIDLNRNWPLDFGQRGGQAVSDVMCGETFSGRSYFQAEETLALCELLGEVTGESPRTLCSRTNPQRATGTTGRSIDAAIDFHAYGQVVLGAWAHTNQPGPMHRLLNHVGMEMAQAMEPQHYLYGTGDADGSAYLTSGTFPDWLHYAFDSLAYTVELPPESWDMGNFLLDGQLILGAARSAYKGMHRMLEVLLAPPDDVAEASPLTAGHAKDTAACQTFSKIVTVDIQPDLYPAELSWEIRDSSGGILAEWTKQRYQSSAASTELTAAGGNVRLCEPGVYLFVIRDDFGDGVCCDHGNGNFRLLVDGVELYKHNGQFQAHTVAALQIDDSPAVRGVTPSDVATEIMTELEGTLDYTAPASVVPAATEAPTMPPTAAPSTPLPTRPVVLEEKPAPIPAPLPAEPATAPPPVPLTPAHTYLPAKDRPELFQQQTGDEAEVPGSNGAETSGQVADDSGERGGLNMVLVVVGVAVVVIAIAVASGMYVLSSRSKSQADRNARGAKGKTRGVRFEADPFADEEGSGGGSTFHRQKSGMMTRLLSLRNLASIKLTVFKSGEMELVTGASTALTPVKTTLPKTHSNISLLRSEASSAVATPVSAWSAVNTGNNSPVSYASGSRPRAWGKAFEDALAEIADPSLSPVKEVASPVEDLRYASPVDDLHYRREQGRYSIDDTAKDTSRAPSGVQPSCDEAPQQGSQRRGVESFMSVESVGGSRPPSQMQLHYPGEDFPDPKPRAIGRWD
eukprot:jgi/Tetstr1/433241/TSEL_022529.t1